MERGHIFLAAALWAAVLFPVIANAAAPLSPEAVTANDQALIVAELNLQSAIVFNDTAEDRTRLLQNERPDFLARLRRSCGVGNMPAVLAAVAADRRRVQSRNARAAPMPDLATYCRAVVSEAVRRGATADLYKDLAVQEQGAMRANETTVSLLTRNEAWQTTMAVLTAANAGAVSYTSISGAIRPLTCALAMDAGASWAASAPNAQAPLALADSEADAIIIACYDKNQPSIMVHGTKMPASKAGLVVGAWLGKRP